MTNDAARQGLIREYHWVEEECVRMLKAFTMLILMGHSVQMEVIAEDVEHEDKMQVRRGLGCDCIQGFLRPRPSPPEKMEALLDVNPNSFAAAKICVRMKLFSHSQR
jgi:EAL domain-containing protein (putative c-di-GMP-specific phosphodiesterase class I)